MKRFLALLAAAPLAGLLFATAASAAEPESPYGIHSHVSRPDEHPFLDREMALYEQADIAWLRTGFVWAALERKDDQWDFQRCDDVVDRAEASGVKIMGLLHGTPRWAKPTIEHLDAWLELVGKTVERYRGRVPAWQVWNEPNLEHFWANPNPQHYATLLKATYAAIKRADPEALVVWGATSRLDWEFLRPALAQADGKFDVMAIHPYGYGDPRAPEAYIPDAIEELRRLLRAHGVGDRPIWFTEWGWPTHRGPRGISNRQQGQYIARAHILALHAGLQRSFWYEFQERKEADEENEDAFGIVEYDLRPKPAYVAYRTLIAARPPGSEPVDSPWKTGLVYHPAWKRPDGTTVHAVWNLWGRWNSPRMTDVLLEGTLEAAHDYLGRKVEIAVEPSGRAVLPLDWGSPIYLVGPQRVRIE